MGINYCNLKCQCIKIIQCSYIQKHRYRYSQSAKIRVCTHAFIVSTLWSCAFIFRTSTVFIFVAPISSKMMESWSQIACLLINCHRDPFFLGILIMISDYDLQWDR